MAFPWQALLGIAGGFLGPKQKLSPEQKFQMQIANELRDYSRSAPISDPGERAALSQQQGMLGEQLRQSRDQAYGAYTQANQGNVGDMMTNLGNQQTGFRMALDAQHLMAAMQSRNQARTQAAGVAQGVGQRQETGGGMAEMFGKLAQLTSYNRARQAGANPQMNGRGEMGAADPRSQGVQLQTPNMNPFNTPQYGAQQSPQQFFGSGFQMNIPQPRSMMMQPPDVSLQLPGFTFGKKRGG